MTLDDVSKLARETRELLQRFKCRYAIRAVDGIPRKIKADQLPAEEEKNLIGVYDWRSSEHEIYEDVVWWLQNYYRPRRPRKAE